MSFFSAKRTKGGNMRLVFDFGSGSVGCAVSTLRGGGRKPYIHYTTRVSISPKEQLDYDRFTNATFAAFRETAEKAKRYLSQTQTLDAVGGVVVVLSSPWYASRTYDMVHNDAEEFTVSSSLIQKVLDSQEVEQTKEETDILQQKRILDPAIFERRILDISLNGYKVKNPLNKQATRLEISVFTAVVSLAFYQRLQQVVQEEFNSLELALHSHVLSVFTTIRDCFGPQGDFLLVDVSREVTEIALSLDDVLQNTVSIPFGTTKLIQGIASSKEGNEQEALSLVSLAGKGTKALDPGAPEGKAVAQEAARWHRHFSEALERLVGTKAYPRNLFLTAPTPTLEYFVEIIENENDETTDQAPIFEVTPLLSCLTQNLIEMDKDAEVDSMLALETLHIARL